MKTMEHWARRLYEGFGKTKLAFCILAAALYAALTVWAGGSLWGLGLFWLAAAVYVVLPGLLLSRLPGVRAAAPGFQEPLAFLLGSGFLVCLMCVSSRFGAWWLVRGLPPLLAAAAVALWIRRGAKRPGPTRKSWWLPHRQALAVLLFALVGLYAFACVVKYALPSRAGDVLIDQDFLWLVGNAKSFQIDFPPQEIRFYNVRLAYHYLTELLCASFSTVAGLDCYEVLAFYQQPALLLALLVCLYRFGLVFYKGSRAKATALPWVLFGFSCASLWAVLPNGLSLFGNSNITHLLTNITSQCTATVYLAVFCGLWVGAARKRFRVGWAQLAVVLCSFVMLTVAKGPVGGILLAAAAVSLPFLLATRKAGGKAVALTAGMGAVFAVLYQMLFSAGANGGMTLSLTDSVARTPLAAALSWFDSFGYGLSGKLAPLVWPVLLALLAPAVLVPWLRGLAKDVPCFWRLPAERLLANACVFGGLLAFFIFRHPHFSQVYFFLLAFFFMDVLAVDALPLLNKARRGVKALAGALACLGLCTAAFLYLHDVGSGARWFLRDVGVLDKYPYDCVMNADDEAAAHWLRDNTDAETTRFATNRVNTDNLHDDGISNIYTALSGRQAILEGYTYVADTAPWMWVDERRADNAALFAAGSTPAQILELCRKHGVTHLVYSSQIRTGSESGLQFMNCVFSSPTVRVYEVPAEG